MPCSGPGFETSPQICRRSTPRNERLSRRGVPFQLPNVAPFLGASSLSSVNVWSLCLMYGFVGFSGNFITNLLPLYLADNRGLTPEATTWLAGLPLAFGVVSCVLGGFLSNFVSRRWGSRKWGRRLNASLGLALAGLALLVVPWVEAIWLLALL